MIYEYILKLFYCQNIFKEISKNLCIMFRLFTTFGAGNRAMQSIDPRPKCGGGFALGIGRIFCLTFPAAFQYSDPALSIFIR
jgi:hypothetical protein